MRIAVGLMAIAASVASALAVEATPGEMASLPAGLYRPFLDVTAPAAGDGDAARMKRVGAFLLGVEPVTNAEFLAFVVAHPEWRKSQIKAVFADEGYLRRWPSDLKLADEAARDEPVTNISWFAAEAYCKAQGLRLPTTDQWEYALADEGRGAAEVRARSLEWFAEPNETRPAAVGAGAANGFGLRDLVGLVWEWTLDFDAYAIASDGAFSCSGAAARAADPTDYPAFMRYSMRESLKASYTADNLGFRCAGAAP
jgi:formylglycine-generating enzyme